MLQPGDVHKFAGVKCTAISPEQWQWAGSGGFLWVFELWGRKLRWGARVVAEGIKTIQAAVTLSQGFEIGWTEHVRQVEHDRRIAANRESPSGSMYAGSTEDWEER